MQLKGAFEAVLIIEEMVYVVALPRTEEYDRNCTFYISTHLVISVSPVNGIPATNVSPPKMNI
jgi:hypothetical protein